MAEILKDRTVIAHVDDDTDILAIAKAALEAFGPFDVASFSSGKVALKSLGCTAPALVILDLQMPEMDGRETLKQIRKIPALQDTPVIFLTAAKSREVELELMKLGAVSVIAKPFDPMTLHLEIDKYIPKPLSGHAAYPGN